MSRSRFSALIPVDRSYGPANKYDPEYCWKIRELGQDGKFVEEWVSEMGVTLSTLYHWANLYPEFEQAMHEAHWLCRAFWAKMARESKQGIGMPPSVLGMILERRFPDMWGKNAKNMHLHFETRNDPPEGEGDNNTPQEIANMDTDTLQDRIKRLEERRRHADEVNK